MSRDDLTIVVCSCDKYEDLWYPYFKIFSRQWPNCPYPIVLNTETKKFEFEGLSIICPQLYSGKDAGGVSWSDRMIETLRHINSEYILITCDDHFLASPVDEERFEEALGIIKQNKRITTLSFVPHISEDEKTKWIGDFGLWKMSKNFRVNLDTAIWRKSRLEKLLKPGEDIWQFETVGTERALWDFTEFYKYKIGAQCIIDAPFHQRRGYGIVKGKWCWNMPTLFSQFEIEMDYNVRGLMTKEECLRNVERDNVGDAALVQYYAEKRLKKILHEVKRRIPVEIRIKLSKVKQAIIKIKW